MESRKPTMSVRAGLNQSLPVHAFERLPGTVSAATGPAWQSCSGVQAAATASDARPPMTSNIFSSTHRQHAAATYVTEGRWQDAAAKREDKTFGKRFATCIPPPPPPPLAPTLPPSASSSRGRGDPPPPRLSSTTKSPQPRQLSRSPVGLDSRRVERPRPRQAPSEGERGGDSCGDSDAAGDAFPGEQPGGAWAEDFVGDGLERDEGHDSDGDEGGVPRL